MLLCFPVLRRMSRFLPVWRRATLYVADIYPRGGGTGTNGRARRGIVLICPLWTRVKLILKGWVRVGRGDKDQLNQALKPYGYFCAGTFHQ